jgi:hypothetical protein
MSMAESKSIPNIAERWIDLYKFLRTAQEVTPDDGNRDPFEKCKAAYRAWRESGAVAVDMRSAVKTELNDAFKNLQVVNTGPTPDQEQKIWDAAQNADEQLKIATYEVFMRMGRWDRLTKEHVSRVQRQWNARLLTRRRFQQSHWNRRKNPVPNEHVETMKVVDHPVVSLCVGHVVQGPAANDDRVLELLPEYLTITSDAANKKFTYNPLMHVLRTLYMEFRLHALHSQINKGHADVGTRVFWVRLLGAMYKNKKIESSETKVVFSNTSQVKPIYAVPPYIVVHQVGLKIKDEDEYEWVLSQLFKPLEMPGVGQSPGGKSDT